MSDVRPFTKEERAKRVLRAQNNLAMIPEHPTFYQRSAYHTATATLRWDVTVCQLEAERDAAMVFVARWLDGNKPSQEAAHIRAVLASQGYSQMRSAEMAGIAAALEAMPEDIPGIADAIDAVYSRMTPEEGDHERAISAGV